MCLIQDNFLIQHLLEPTRGGRVLYLVLSSQKEYADNVNIQEPLGSSDHNQLHFNPYSADFFYFVHFDIMLPRQF